MKKQKSKNELLLTSIYQNVRTGLQSIGDIMPSIKYNLLIKELKSQECEYTSIAHKCESIAAQKGFELPDNNFFEKIRLWSSIKMSTIADKSTRHVTEMLLLGTFMGCIQCEKDSLDYKSSDKEIFMLLKKLQVFEQDNIDKLKKFL